MADKKLSKDDLAVKFDNVEFEQTRTISGPYKKDENGKAVLDKDGNRVHTWGPHTVKYTISFNDATLKKALEKACDSIAIDIARVRSKGEDETLAIDGKKFNAKDFKSGRSKLSKVEKLNKGLWELTDEERLELFKQWGVKADKQGDA